MRACQKAHIIRQQQLSFQFDAVCNAYADGMAMIVLINENSFAID
ncbi:MAG: hypothetical protein Q4E16_05490 [Neisseria sp.]|nr:hypothetical protein [Neisseria sp.]